MVQELLAEGGSEIARVDNALLVCRPLQVVKNFLGRLQPHISLDQESLEFLPGIRGDLCGAKHMRQPTECLLAGRTQACVPARKYSGHGARLYHEGFMLYSFSPVYGSQDAGEEEECALNDR